MRSFAAFMVSAQVIAAVVVNAEQPCSALFIKVDGGGAVHVLDIESAVTITGFDPSILGLRWRSR